MATKIGSGQPAPKRVVRRRSKAPWSIGLGLLLFIFWKYVGGPGGWVPGSGPGSASDDKSAPRSAPIHHDSTARRVVTQFSSIPTPQPVERVRKASVRVSPSAQPGSETAEVTLRIAEGQGVREAGTLEIRPRAAAESRTPVEARSFPIAGGQATIDGVKRGDKLRVKIVPDGQPSLSGEMTVEDGDEIELIEQAVIKGRAGYADGSPAANQELVVKLFRANQEPEVTEVRTRADGSFDVATRAGHDVLIELRPKGHAAGSDVDPVVEQRPVLDASTPWDLGSLKFEREVLLVEGTIQDESGNPVPNATALVLPLDLPIRALTARSDSEGRFTVKGPPTVGPIEVFGLTEDRAGRAPAALQKGATDVKVALAPAGSIKGRVLSPAPALNPLLRVELRTELRNLYAATPVLADGTFGFPHVPAGRYSILVAAPDRTADPITAIDVPIGGPSTDVRLATVPVKTDFAPAILRVMDTSGAPIPDAHVEIAIPPSTVLRERTGGTGLADVALPPATAVSLSVEAQGYTAFRESWDGKRAITLASAGPESPASRPVR